MRHTRPDRDRSPLPRTASSGQPLQTQRIINWPLASICSDGDLDGGHPRGAGAFPRFLRHYVLDKDPSKLPDAIRRATSLTAERYGIPDRGLIAVGRPADVVLIDTATVKDNASMTDALAVSSGIKGVWVNGEQVWDGAKSTGKRPGEIVRRARS
jgi:N-acyl-D-amino-acid deacylase